MNNYRNIFCPAKILLPKDHHEEWAVIACDQFTSQPEYWEECVEKIGEHPSSYDYILPEAYLGTELESVHREDIDENMANFNPADMIDCFGDSEWGRGFIYVERTLPDGKIRHGIVGKIDLEAYDYSPGSHSPVRATEATVLSRIPPRVKIRESAAIELPHILVLIDDKTDIFGWLKEAKERMPAAYDFDLMQGGGHLKGWMVTAEQHNELIDRIAAHEESCEDVVYAMGDGNHSLASAKAHWENMKAKGADPNHPARWALCEVTALEDESLVFEPIYRILKNCDEADVFRSFAAQTKPGRGEQTVRVVTRGIDETVHFPVMTHGLTIGTLQDFLDRYCKDHPGVECDYIHGDNAAVMLADAVGTVGFLTDVMDKSELIPYVEKNGTLPRKTFSMGEAESKRYYMECRMIR